MATSAEAAQAVLEAARGLVAERGARRLEVKALGPGFEVAPGFQRSRRYTTYRISPEGGEQAVWKRLDRTSVQQRIRKGEKAGVQVVMGCGWYRGSYYPPEARIDRRTVDDLAAELIAEFTDGVAGTGVHPGIIGEIGVDKVWVNALEERVHRAAARAALATGMAISTHGIQSPVGLDQLRIFTEEGVDPGRVVIGHADSYPVLDHYLELLDRGANLEFDFIGHRFGTEEAAEPRLIELIVELLERGYGAQLLLSQDVAHNSQLRANGGSGYAYLQQHFLPSLRTAAVAEGEIAQMTIENPRRILTVG